MKLLLTSILFFLFNLIYCQENLDSIITKCRVKEVKIFDEEKKLVSLTRYDTLGRMLHNEVDNFTGATSLKTSMTKIYDQNGNVLKTISTHSSYPYPTIWIYEYDTDGNNIAVKTEQGDYVFQYFYNDSKFLILKLAYDDDKTIRQTISYQKLDNEKKSISSNKGIFIKNRTTTTYYDDFGNAIKVESYDGEKLNFSLTSEFSERKLTKQVYDSKYGNIYFYNREGRLKKRQQFKIEDNVEVIGNFEEFTYHDNGLIETYQENIYSKNLRQYKYAYLYYN